MLQKFRDHCGWSRKDRFSYIERRRSIILSKEIKVHARGGKEMGVEPAKGEEEK